uniref:Uncharacterized protein n=1 Tax=Polytomella parva TaxID=51329 RepID=A0A7S0ULD6_9CHLO
MGGKDTNGYKANDKAPPIVSNVTKTNITYSNENTTRNNGTKKGVNTSQIVAARAERKKKRAKLSAFPPAASPSHSPSSSSLLSKFMRGLYHTFLPWTNGSRDHNQRDAKDNSMASKNGSCGEADAASEGRNKSRQISLGKGERKAESRKPKGRKKRDADVGSHDEALLSQRHCRRELRRQKAVMAKKAKEESLKKLRIYMNDLINTMTDEERITSKNNFYSVSVKRHQKKAYTQRVPISNIKIYNRRQGIVQTKPPPPVNATSPSLTSISPEVTNKRKRKEDKSYVDQFSISDDEYFENVKNESAVNQTTVASMMPTATTTTTTTKNQENDSDLLKKFPANFSSGFNLVNTSEYDVVNQSNIVLKYPPYNDLQLVRLLRPFQSHLLLHLTWPRAMFNGFHSETLEMAFDMGLQNLVSSHSFGMFWKENVLQVGDIGEEKFQIVPQFMPVVNTSNLEFFDIYRKPKWLEKEKETKKVEESEGYMLEIDKE